METPSFKSEHSEINALKFTIFSRHQKWIALNVLHSGQALATALKSNSTVVDINLADNWLCGDDLAEVWWTWVQSE